ncbi:MAG: hypothetical protein ACYC35_06010 [Pirellulales bacterium]
MMETQVQTQFMPHTAAISDHAYDLIRELHRRLDAVWRYDQCIANADWRCQLTDYWHKVKQQDLENVEHLKHLIASEINQGGF